MGKELGVKETKKEIIRRMREKGLTTDEIVELTGIPKATVSRIKS
jgi:DNA invertase Pin-like site-specific DNA recombinase